MNPRLFPNLQELSLNRVIELYGSEELERVIKEDETANPGIQVTIPGIRVLKPLLIKKLRELVSPLMLSVVQGDLKQTQTLINACPRLSSVKGETIDYSRRTIRNLTPFQAALCAWDDEMCGMLKQYMSDEQVANQYQEIFAEGHENYYKVQTAFDFDTLVNVITQSNDGEIQEALNLRQTNSLLCQTLNQFRTDFTLCSQEEIVFNPKHLIKAFEIYNEQFDRWDWNKRDLFWRQVIGYVQRFLPANIAQDFAQGLYYRVEEKEKPRRSFDFRFGGGAIFPLAGESFSGLGYDWGPLLSGSCWLCLAVAYAACYKTYVEQKLQTCRTYAVSPNIENGFMYSRLK